MKRSLIGSGGGKGSLETWCSDVTTEEARALAQILDEAGVRDRHEDVIGLRHVFGARDAGATEITLSIGPLLPHET